MEAKFPLNAAAVQIDSEIDREPLLSFKPKVAVADEPVKEYAVPNFGVDSDILDAQKNMADMESKFPLKAEAVQLDS